MTLQQIKDKTKTLIDDLTHSIKKFEDTGKSASFSNYFTEKSVLQDAWDFYNKLLKINEHDEASAIVVDIMESWYKDNFEDIVIY